MTARRPGWLVALATATGVFDLCFGLRSTTDGSVDAWGDRGLATAFFTLWIGVTIVVGLAISIGALVTRQPRLSRQEAHT